MGAPDLMENVVPKVELGDQVTQSEITTKLHWIVDNIKVDERHWVFVWHHPRAIWIRVDMLNEIVHTEQYPRYTRTAKYFKNNGKWCLTTWTID